MSCECALKVRDNSNSASVAACSLHRLAEFRVRVWIVSKGFLFTSTRDDTGSEAKDGLPTQRCPFFPEKYTCNMENYVAERSKDATTHLGISLFVNGEARTTKHYFAFESQRPANEAETTMRLARALQTALRELKVPVTEAAVSALVATMQDWLPAFRYSVHGAGTSPGFLQAVREQRAAQNNKDIIEGCVECGAKLDDGRCQTCEPILVVLPKNKRTKETLESEQVSKRLHLEIDDAKHEAETPIVTTPFNPWQSPSSRDASPKRRKSNSNPFEEEDEGDEVKVTRHIFNLESAQTQGSPNKRRVKMETKEQVLSGIGEVLNDSKYGEFLEQVRSLAMDFTTQYKLPRIVVIGSESAGKSSVLERIAMQPVFPRDRNLCTRCPIKLSLRNDPRADELEPVTVRFGRRTLTVLQGAVGDTVKKLMNEAVCELNGGPFGIVGEELVIEMRKPNVPTIDLIDLPGIVAASLPDEPGDMMKQTRELVERYVKDPNTLVVAVVPATIKRVRDAQAMQIVQAHNAQNRTIGVLTMADLVHDSYGNDPRWELRERLNGVSQDLVKLPAGYIAVKSRDMRENLSIAEAAVQELEWFTANLPEFDRTERVSSMALIRQLDQFYTAHIRAKWVPEALKGLNHQAAGLLNDATVLGPDPQDLGIEGLLTATAALNGIMEKALARLVSEHLKPNFTACFGQTDVQQTYPSVGRARQTAHNKKVCASLLSDQWFPDTCVKVAKQVVASSFASSNFNVKLCRFENLRTAFEGVASEIVLENMTQFRQTCLKRIKISMPSIVEFLELVLELLFLPFFDVLASPLPQLQSYLVGRGVDMAGLLVETHEAQRRELTMAHQHILQACQLLTTL